MTTGTPNFDLSRPAATAEIACCEKTSPKRPARASRNTRRSKNHG